MKLTRKIYATRNEKILDFVIGFVGWYFINGLMYACSFMFLTYVSVQEDSISLALLVVPLIVNIISLIVLGMTRRWIALGALVAFALLLLGALVIGLLVYAICFNTNTFR
jgi:hypothetical protein